MLRQALQGYRCSGAVISGIGVPAVIAALACSYLALGLLPLLAPSLRATVEFIRGDRVTGEAWADRGRSGSTST